MKENNDFIIRVIKKKIYSAVLLAPITIFLLLTWIVLFKAEPANPGDESAKFYIATFFMFFVIFFGWIFYNTNKKMKFALYIKENGKQYQGRVINAQKRYVRTRDGYQKKYIDVLVEFTEGFCSKYIVVRGLPYNLKLKDDSNSFGSSNISDEIDEELKIVHSQYMSKGYITFDNHDQLGKEIIYTGSKIKNFLENDLTCTVFELDGKYVVDDYVVHN